MGRFASKSFTAREYLMAGLANPRMFLSAVAYKMRHTSRHVESSLRAEQKTEIRVRGQFSSKRGIDIDDLLAALAAHMGVICLERHPDTTTIGIADIDAISLVYFLSGNISDLDFRIDGKAVHLTSRHFKSRVLKAKTLGLSYNNRALDRCNLIIEVYRKLEPGVWMSPNAGNLIMRKLYGDMLEVPGLHEATDILGAPTLHQIAAERPIDIVYTWVNHEDPDWQMLYRRATASPDAVPTEEMSADSNSLSRFHNKNELKFSLRSIEKNMPWVNRIFVFTNCAPPAWLNVEHPKIVWVRHEDVIPSRHLPVFSSHVIESYLHRIEGLSEKFVYFNDDFFVMMPLSKKHFYHENGIARVQLESYAMVSGPVKEGDADYLNASRNSARLLCEAFGHMPVQLHKHVPYPLSKSILTEIESRFEAEIEAFRGNRFRMSNDLNIPSFLYPHYALATERATLGGCRSVLAKSNDIRWRSRLREAERGNCQILCINDGGDLNTSGLWEGSVAEFLNANFGTVAPWELSGAP